MKIVLCGTWDTTEGSLGAQALSDGLLHTVHEIYPEAQIYRTKQFSSKYFKSIFFRSSLVAKILKKFIFNYFKILYKKYAYEDYQAIKNADFVIVSGDGIVTDIFPQSALQLATEISFCIDHQTKFVSLNQSANFLENGFVGWLFKNYFMRANVQLREEDSFQFVKSLPNPYSISIYRGIDTAFLTKPLSKAEEEYYDKDLIAPIYQRYQIQKNDFICVGIRSNRPGGQNIDIEAWAMFLHHVKLKTGKKLVYTSTANHLDKVNGHKLQKYIKDLILINEFDDYGRYNYRVIERFIQLASLSISDRYHQNVFALIAETPLIAFEANTIKTKGLINTMGYRGEIFPLPNKNNVEFLCDKFDSAFNALGEINFEAVKINIKKKNTYREFLQNA